MPITERGDSTSSIDEYLQCMCEDAGAGVEEITDRDFGEGVLEPDFRSQLIAIRIVLERNHEAEEKVSAEIKKLEADIRERGGNSWMVDRWVDELYSSTFLDSTHSMAAVALIVPLMESLFDRAFRYLKHAIGESHSLGSGHERWQLDDPWDHRYMWKRGRRSRGIAKGIVQLAEAIDLRKHLPGDLERTLSVLFKYRNKMFHCGLEWPKEDVKHFANLIRSNGWAECFARAESGRDPCTFYMSREFIDHCLDTVDEVIAGIGAYVRLHVHLF
ncbi:hypothetical protein [Candidatus Palauibacter soopunensis]|uniref:hypothetical protein n=1 Tax=Candidatus Palauibacter soopunensis TaxID=3056739 RepID=UPI00239340BA|nr:hypothetical protein [Candidatus Palauibacter soopunensis]MDE2879134.1 hypothetical protein [Candidatus Palauibacter soopunensis]